MARNDDIERLCRERAEEAGISLKAEGRWGSRLPTPHSVSTQLETMQRVLESKYSVFKKHYGIEPTPKTLLAVAAALGRVEGENAALTSAKETFRYRGAQYGAWPARPTGSWQAMPKETNAATQETAVALIREMPETLLEGLTFQAGTRYASEGQLVSGAATNAYVEGLRTALGRVAAATDALIEGMTQGETFETVWGRAVPTKTVDTPQPTYKEITDIAKLQDATSALAVDAVKLGAAWASYTATPEGDAALARLDFNPLTQSAPVARSVDLGGPRL